MPGQTSLEQSLNTRLLSFSFADYISFTAVNSFQWILSNLAPEKDCSNSNFSMVHWGLKHCGSLLFQNNSEAYNATHDYILCVCLRHD